MAVALLSEILIGCASCGAISDILDSFTESTFTFRNLMTGDEWMVPGLRPELYSLSNADRILPMGHNMFLESALPLGAGS